MSMKSSHIRAIEAAPGGGVRVTFANGSTYHYPKCPPELVQKCLTAKSVGQAFHQHIRRRYQGRQI
jgi:hypothetical protein